MQKNTPPRFDPAELAELLERTRKEVRRYRLLHPEWRRPLEDGAPGDPAPPPIKPA